MMRELDGRQTDRPAVTGTNLVMSTRSASYGVCAANVTVLERPFDVPCPRNRILPGLRSLSHHHTHAKHLSELHNIDDNSRLALGGSLELFMHDLPRSKSLITTCLSSFPSHHCTEEAVGIFKPRLHCTSCSHSFTAHPCAKMIINPLILQLISARHISAQDLEDCVQAYCSSVSYALLVYACLLAIFTGVCEYFMLSASCIV